MNPKRGAGNSNTPVKTKAMRFLHITDLHFWNIVYNPVYLCNKRILGNLNLLVRRRKYLHTDRSASFVDLLRTLQVDGIFIGGDLTTTAMPGEFLQAAAFLQRLAGITSNIYLLPGNHDVYTFESCRRRRFESYFGQYAPTVGDTSVSTLAEGLSLFRVPTVRPNLLSSRGIVTPAQLERTRAMIAMNTGHAGIVLAHYPLLQSVPGYRLSSERRLINAEGLREIVGQSPVPVLYLAGHVHAFSHTVDPVYEHITHVTSSALFYGKKGRQGGFTEIETEGSAFKITPWYYQDGWVRGQASLPVPLDHGKGIRAQR